MIAFLFSLSAYGQLCPEATYSTDLTAAIAKAEGTFSDLDIPAFRAATDELRSVMPCLRDPVTRSVAAEVHRFLGLRAFGDRDPDTRLYFAAARSIEPYYEFPASLIPPGNPVRAVYADLETGQGLGRDVPEPAEGYLQFDGRTTLKRPVTWPTLMQRFDEAGQVVFSAYLAPDDPTPVYPVNEETPVEVPPTPSGPPALRLPLLVGTATAALTTGVLYGMAGSAEARFKDPNTPDASLVRLERTANTLVIVSGVTGAATVGLGIGFATTF